MGGKADAAGTPGRTTQNRSDRRSLRDASTDSLAPVNCIDPFRYRPDSGRDPPPERALRSARKPGSCSLFLLPTTGARPTTGSSRHVLADDHQPPDAPRISAIKQFEERRVREL